MTLLRMLLMVFAAIEFSGCRDGGADSIADHQSRIIEFRDDGLFTVTGSIVRDNTAKMETVTARPAGFPLLNAQDAKNIRAWMAKTLTKITFHAPSCQMEALISWHYAPMAKVPFDSKKSFPS